MTQLLAIIALVVEGIEKVGELIDSVATPVKKLFSGPALIVVIIAFIGGVILDPTHALQNWICWLVTNLCYFLPKSPDNLKIVNLGGRLADNIPFIGSGIIRKIISDFLLIIGLAIPIKIYKLLPGKGT